MCVGAEHYGGLHHAREMPLRTHALPAGLSSAPPKNLRKQKRLRFPRSAAAQVASVVGSRGDTSRLPKTSLPPSLSLHSADPRSLSTSSLTNCHGSSTSHSETSAHFTLLTASSRLAQRAHFYSPGRAPLIGRGDSVGGASGASGGVARFFFFVT